MKVLVGVHATPEGEAAQQRAIAEVARSEGTLVLFDLVLQDAKEADTGSFDELERRRELVRQRAGQIAREHGIRTVTHVPAGYEDVAQAMLDAADQHDIDLIVLGMRRRSRVGKLVLGSTAQSVLLNADCPVLAVKAPRRGS